MKFFIDNLPVSIVCFDERQGLCSHNVDNLPIWPYLSRSVYIPPIVESTYRKLIRAICIHVWSQENIGCHCNSPSLFVGFTTLTKSLGPLRLGNAFRDRENCITVVFNRVISTGFDSAPSVWNAMYLMTISAVLSNPPQTRLLLAYRSWDRKDTHWAEKIDELSDLMRRNRWTKRKGEELHGPWADK